MSTTTPPNEAVIVDGLDAEMSPEGAAAILSFGFSEAQRSRMRDLAAKARGGELTGEERAEADSFERVSSLLGIFQSKARMSLKRANS